MKKYDISFLSVVSDGLKWYPRINRGQTEGLKIDADVGVVCC